MSNVITRTELPPAPAPAIEEQAVMPGMEAFEADFGVPSIEAQVDMVAMDASEQQEDIQLVTGFNPILLNLYLKAEAGSSFQKQIEQAMVADMVVRNAVAFNLETPYDVEMNERREEERKKKEAILA